MNENETLPDWLVSDLAISSDNTASLVVGEPNTEPTTSELTSSENTSSEPTPPPLTASELADIINSTIASQIPSEPVTSEITSSTTVELPVMEKPFEEYTPQEFSLVVIMICVIVGLAISAITLIKRK